MKKTRSMFQIKSLRLKARPFILKHKKHDFLFDYIPEYACCLSKQNTRTLAGNIPYKLYIRLSTTPTNA